MLLRHQFAGPTKFTKLIWKIFEFWKLIVHRVNRLCIIDVHSRSEFQSRHNPGQYIDNSDRRVADHQMPAAFRAKLAVTHAFGGLVKNPNVF